MKQFVSRIVYFFSIAQCMPPYTYSAGYVVGVDPTVCTVRSFIVIFIASLYFIIFRFIFIISFFFILFSFTFCSFSRLEHLSRNLTVCIGCYFRVIFIILFYFILLLFMFCSFRALGHFPRNLINDRSSVNLSIGGQQCRSGQQGKGTQHVSRSTKYYSTFMNRNIRLKYAGMNHNWNWPEGFMPLTGSRSMVNLSRVDSDTPPPQQQMAVWSACTGTFNAAPPAR